MSTAISMIILEKTKGLPFHKLSIEEQESINQEIQEQEEKGTYKEPVEVFSAGNHFALMDFFAKSLENLADNFDLLNDDLYYYIDFHNVDNVLESTKKEIDHLYEKVDRFDPDIYLPSSTLARLAQFYQAVRKTSIEKGFEEYYLIVEIG